MPLDTRDGIDSPTQRTSIPFMSEIAFEVLLQLSRKRFHRTARFRHEINAQLVLPFVYQLELSQPTALVHQ